MKQTIKYGGLFVSVLKQYELLMNVFFLAADTSRLNHTDRIQIFVTLIALHYAWKRFKEHRFTFTHWQV